MSGVVLRERVDARAVEPGAPLRDGDRRWAWEVAGREFVVGTLDRGFDDSGLIDAPLAGDALAFLVHRGEFWDALDDDEEFRITIRPASSEPSA